uniref:RRM domain-containing protein n=1 Tax=Phlebotomus kandelakii TaxID=1109342 RepID=A0A6B2EIZ8_9DIPT
MSVIIRLQNLPWSANALDIRGFFRNLSILDGGVNIVGGEMGDAFIAFSTDEDARQAMMMDGGKIKEVGVRLSLSSRAEMQKVIEVARQSSAAFAPITTPISAPAPAATVPVPVTPVITTVVATPIVDTPAVVSVAGGTLTTSPLSNLLTQQMLQQKLRQQEQENFQQQLEQQLLEHKKQLLQQQMVKQQGAFPVDLAAGKSLLVGDLTQQLALHQQLPTLMQNQIKDPRGSLEMVEQLKDPRRSLEIGDKPTDRALNSSERTERDKERRGRDRRSRSRDRRRSRSKDRTGRKRRSDRSRSRERRDRRRRERRTRSREDHDRSSGDREKIRDRHDGKDGGKVGGAAFSTTPQIWDIPPNIPKASQSMLNVQPVLETNVTKHSSLSPDDRVNLMKLSEMRDSGAFQSNMWKGRGFGNSPSNSDHRKNSDTNRCIRISGMDPITGYGEIRRFFYGLSISTDGIKMINDKNGKRIGMACIEFMRSDTRRVALARDGLMLKDCKVHIDAITQDEFDKEVDSFRPAFNRGDNRGGRSYNDNQDTDDLPLNDNKMETRCLKVTNLPSHATQQDIIKMYSNFSLDEIVLVQENSRVLTAYVRFYRMEDSKLAFNLPAGHFHYRGLEISLCDENKFNSMLMYSGGSQGFNQPQEIEKHRNDKYNDVQTMSPDDDEQEENPNDSMESEEALHVVEDEPDDQEVFEVNDDDVNPAEVEVSMDIVSQESNEECTPVFKKQEDPRLAKTTLNESIQSTFNQSSLDPRLNQRGFNRSAPPQAESRDPRLNPSVVKKKSDCVVISNLEPKTTDRDVVDFFSDVGLIPLRVHILLNTMGQPSGDCFVEFTSSEDADKALSKHKQHLGQNEVTVEAIARQKVEEILNSFEEPSPPFEVDSPDDMTPPPPMNYAMRGGFGMQPPMMRMRGPFPPRPPMGLNGPGGPPMAPFHRPPYGMRMNGNGMMNMMTPGCIVSVENLPYRAKYDDILDFFGDFELTPADIMRRFNDKGQPTGDARVRFINPAEAMRAVDTRHQMRIMGRPVYLTLLEN